MYPSLKIRYFIIEIILFPHENAKNRIKLNSIAVHWNRIKNIDYDFYKIMHTLNLASI